MALLKLGDQISQVSETEEIKFRFRFVLSLKFQMLKESFNHTIFRTSQRDAFILATEDDASIDRLEIALGNNNYNEMKNIRKPLFVSVHGRLRASMTMGLTEKSVIVGDALHDDNWHAVHFKRSGMIVTFAVDDKQPLVGEGIMMPRVRSKDSTFVRDSG